MLKTPTVLSYLGQCPHLPPPLLLRSTGTSYFLISGAQSGGANRRSTSIYHSAFKGTGVHDDRHKIVESVGRGGVTEAIKAHERQMGLYICGLGWGGGSPSACYHEQWTPSSSW